MTSYWVHDLDPVALHLGANFGIRWYGLAYALAFVIGAWLLARYYKGGKSPLDPGQQSSFMLAVMIGVLAGGRLGYVLLYDLQSVLDQPLSVIQIWKGGMSSHGGFVGVIIACLWSARASGVSPLLFGDLVCTLAPVGFLLGRVANFINGELWGRVTDVTWAVIFPLSEPAGTPVEYIAPRHPSQLYEAGLEGLFLLAFTQWRLWKTDALKTPGRLSGEFYMLYALVRVLGEQFREPDAALILSMSRGSFYSLFIFGAGLVLYFCSRRKRA